MSSPRAVVQVEREDARAPPGHEEGIECAIFLDAVLFPFQRRNKLQGFFLKDQSVQRVHNGARVILPVVSWVPLRPHQETLHTGVNLSSH